MELKFRNGSYIKSIDEAENKKGNRAFEQFLALDITKQVEKIEIGGSGLNGIKTETVPILRRKGQSKKV